MLAIWRRHTTTARACRFERSSDPTRLSGPRAAQTSGWSPTSRRDSEVTSTTRGMTMTTITQAAPRPFDEAAFAGRIHIDGEWVIGGGGEIPSIEPATGATLAMVGIADAADVARAAEGAARAQKEWAALPHPARAAVLRRAGQLWEEHAEEISGWNIREVGAIPPLAGFALHVTAAECYEASALPVGAAGLDPLQRGAAALARTADPRRRGRRHLAVQCPADPRHPRRRPGAGSGQCRASQARPAHRRSPAGCRWSASSRKPGCPRVSCSWSREGPMWARRWSPTRVCASSRSPARRAPAARVGEIAGRHLTRAHLELGGNSATSSAPTPTSTRR